MTVTSFAALLKHYGCAGRWGLLRLITACSLGLSPITYAWDGHTLFTYLALKNTLSHQDSVPAEPLESFVNSEQKGLATLLNSIELWSRSNIPQYPPLPDGLVFDKAQSRQPITRQFLHAIRINPFLSYPLFIQYIPQQNHRIHGLPLKKSDVMLPDLAHSAWIYLPSPPLEGVNPKELLSPLEIVGSAADEPDYGMDDGLWTNNPGPIGMVYQWGEQPFGDKK
ncbi:MAG: hypothetical protein ACHP6H_00660, partial [Legionellales bacterium]